MSRSSNQSWLPTYKKVRLCVQVSEIRIRFDVRIKIISTQEALEELERDLSEKPGLLVLNPFSMKPEKFSNLVFQASLA